VRRRWLDWVLGIVLGLVIGLGVLVYFVFVHSEGAIDAPSIDESATTGQTTVPGESSLPAHPGLPEKPTGEGSKNKPPVKQPQEQVPIVKVIGGAPPTDSGPKQLTFHKGEKVRFEIETDEPFSFEIRGLNIKQSIEESSIISFKATKAGQFPVIATATVIGVADLRIKPPR
jgi:hypothetical protein